MSVQLFLFFYSVDDIYFPNTDVWLTLHSCILIKTHQKIKQSKSG